MKKIAVLGSTGSIGTQTLDVVRKNPDFEITSLSCGRNIRLLEQQIREFHPAFVSVELEEDAADLKNRIRDLNTKVYTGMEGLIQVAEDPASQILVTAIVGMIGIRPTLAAIEAGKDIALANKETLVTAGHLVMQRAAEKNVRILPVDSEHSAIFQCLQGRGSSPVEKILLTASGGPFRGKTRQELEHVTVQDALNHPNWSMGRKITIDSATMVNKGLEEIEAHWLFHVAMDQIEVLVQPQSIIHSAVQFTDGAVIAQLGVPDMRLPIQYALTWPDRRKLEEGRLDFRHLSSIELCQPDRETFQGLSLAEEAEKAGGTMPTVLNAANEYAVAEFLKGRIRFLDIYREIRFAMAHHHPSPDPDLEKILETESWTRDLLQKYEPEIAGQGEQE